MLAFILTVIVFVYDNPGISFMEVRNDHRQGD